MFSGREATPACAWQSLHPLHHTALSHARPRCRGVLAVRSSAQLGTLTALFLPILRLFHTGRPGQELSNFSLNVNDFSNAEPPEGDGAGSVEKLPGLLAPRLGHVALTDTGIEMQRHQSSFYLERWQTQACTADLGILPCRLHLQLCRF